MPTLQVRDLPEDTYNQLRERAQREHRSIAQQTIVALQEYLNNSSDYQEKRQPTEGEKRAERRQKVFERIDARKLPKILDDFPSAAEIIREDRDSR